ncbi:MAG: hypothetical protein IJW20_01800 [Clostridia bacterium]|nr:hypothetical protein [Clostridia bacterium]
MDTKNIFNKIVSKDVIKNIIFFIVIFILIAIRIYMILELPIYGYIDYIDDDQLQVHQAKSLVDGNWLGNYGYNTLLKGPVFPLFLAVISIFKVPYIFSVTLVYAIACCFFIYSIKDIIKNKLALIIIFAFMLFNPIMFSSSFQRVYRNSLTPTLAIVLMSLFNIVLINRNENKMSKYVFGIVLASIVFPFFYYVREDSIWLVPFILFYSFVIIVSVINEIFKNKKIKIANTLKMVLLILPLVTLIIFEQIIGSINLSYYGGKVVNQNNFESLKNVIHSINIVKNVDGNTEVTNSREKIKYLYTISPSLNKIKDNFEFSMDIITGGKGNEIEDGMFLWGFLAGVSSSWYSTYEMQDELYKNISSEINVAIENGTVETQELVPIFQDTLKSKFKLNEFMVEFKDAMNAINDYESFYLMDTYDSKVNYSDFYESRIREFLEITNDKILLEDNELNWKMFGELVSSNQKDYLERMEPKIQNLKSVRDFYDNTSAVIRVVGYLSYLIMTIILIIDLIKKREKVLLNNWIISSGIIGSIITLAAGVAYTKLTKISLEHSFYMMSGYILNNVFGIICIITLFNYFYKVFKNKTNN